MRELHFDSFIIQKPILELNLKRAFIVKYENYLK